MAAKIDMLGEGALEARRRQPGKAQQRIAQVRETGYLRRSSLDPRAHPRPMHRPG